MKELFEKVYIRSADDLPKEDGVYFVAKKNNLKSNGLKPLIFTTIKITKKKWLAEIEYYLLPVEQSEPICKQLDRKRIIEIFIKHLKYGNPTSIQDDVDFNHWVFKNHIIAATDEILSEISEQSEPVTVTDEEVMIYFNNHYNCLAKNAIKTPAMTRSEVLEFANYLRSKLIGK